MGWTPIVWLTIATVRRDLRRDRPEVAVSSEAPFAERRSPDALIRFPPSAHYVVMRDLLASLCLACAVEANAVLVSDTRAPSVGGSGIRIEATPVFDFRFH